MFSKKSMVDVACVLLAAWCSARADSPQTTNADSSDPKVSRCLGSDLADEVNIAIDERGIVVYREQICLTTEATAQAACFKNLKPAYEDLKGRETSAIAKLQDQKKAATPDQTVCLDKSIGAWDKEAQSIAVAQASRDIENGTFRLNSKSEDNQQTPFFRGLAGIDVSGASSTDPSAKFVGDFFADFPLYTKSGADKKKTTGDTGDPKKKDSDADANKPRGPLWARNWIWADARISSIAQPGNLSSFTSAASFLQPALASSPDHMVQDIEFKAGYAFRFHSFDDVKVWPGITARLMLSGIVGFGAITPLAPSQAHPPLYVASDSVQNYVLNNFKDKFKDTNLQNINPFTQACTADATTNPVTKRPCYVAFFPEDRSRFFRNYSAGLRVKVYFRQGRNQLGFPALFDITTGQDEYVTAGHLSNWILHIGGTYPFPFLPGFHVFGALDTAFPHQKSNAQLQQAGLLPILLQPGTSPNLNYTDPSVVTVQIPQPNRDRYKIGVGVDILELIRQHNAKSQGQ